MFDLFINLISCGVSNIMVFDFFDRLFDRKYSCNIIVPFTLLTFMMVTFNSFRITELNYIGTFLFFFIVSKFLYKSRKYNIYIISFFTVVVLMILETIAMLIANYFLTDFLSNNIIYATSVILSLILTLIMYWIITKLLIKREVRITKYTYIETALIALTLLATFAIIDMAKYTTDEKLLIYLLLLSIVFLILDAYFVFVIDIKEKYLDLTIQQKIEKNESEFKIKTYRQKIKNLEEEEKVFHDLRSHLQTLESMYQLGNFETASHYYEEIVHKIPGKNRIVNNEFVHIILTDLKEECKQNNISLKLDVDKKLQFKNMSDYDLVSLFSNLINNAYDATIKCDNKNIELHIGKIKNFIIIEVSNSYAEKLIYKNDKLLSSKNNHTGLGLEIIENIVKKYEGIVNYNAEKNKFCVQVALPILVDEEIMDEK